MVKELFRFGDRVAVVLPIDDKHPLKNVLQGELMSMSQDDSGKITQLVLADGTHYFAICDFVVMTKVRKI